MTSDNTAIGYARRLTLGRGTRAYLDWVSKAIGWGTIAWILFWLVVYAIAAGQLLPRLNPPIASQNLGIIFSSMVGFGLLFVAGRARTPPAFLARRDLYRLGLPALSGSSVLAWPLIQARMTRFILGVVLGGVWTFIGSAWFNLNLPLAAPALGLVFMASLDLEWLTYGARDGDNRTSSLGSNLMLIIIITSSITAWLFGIGLVNSLFNASILGLVTPFMLATVGWIITTQSLANGYPKRFASQAQILGEMRAMQFMMLLTRSLPDPDQQRRLRAQLRDSPTAIRPNRFLRAPEAATGALGALAWRSALSLYRRSLLEHIDLIVRLGVVALSSLTIVRGPGGLVLEIIALVFLLPRLIGPESPMPTLPINAGERTLGRTLPGSIVILVASVLTVVIALITNGFNVNTLGTDLIVTAVTRTVFALLVLEKFATWRGTSTSSIEASVITSVLAVLPTVLLDMFGLSGFTPLVQILLIGVLIVPTP